MDSTIAFLNGEAARRSGARSMVFDWHKAARLIRERKPTCASAGLHGDWEYTGGDIYRDGEAITGDYTYLASLWATPEVNLDGEVEACWIYEDQSDGWDSGTKWPASALSILSGEDAPAPSTVPEDYMSDGPWEVA